MKHQVSALEGALLDAAAAISDLAAQAGATRQFLADGNNPTLAVCFDTQDGSLKRFAALVAEECAKLCDALGQYNDADYSGTIRAHFGLEP